MATTKQFIRSIERMQYPPLRNMLKRNIGLPSIYGETESGELLLSTTINGIEIKFEEPLDAFYISERREIVSEISGFYELAVRNMDVIDKVHEQFQAKGHMSRAERRERVKCKYEHKWKFRQVMSELIDCILHPDNIEYLKEQGLFHNY